MGRSKRSLKQCKSTCFPSTAIGSESLLWRMCTCSTYSPGVIIHKRWPIFVDLHFVQVSVLTVLALYIQGRARYLTFFYSSFFWWGNYICSQLQLHTWMTSVYQHEKLPSPREQPNYRTYICIYIWNVTFSLSNYFCRILLKNNER